MRGIFFVPEADLAAKGAREATGVLDEGVEGFAFAGRGRLVGQKRADRWLLRPSVRIAGRWSRFSS